MSEPSSNMFGGGVVETSGFADESSTAAGTRVRQTVKPASRVGKSFSRDKRKWGNMDVARGIAADVPYEITRDDRMSATDAYAKLQQIWRVFGLDTAGEGDQLAFTRGMFLCHALNSGSQLQPAKSKIFVRGSEFSYAEVLRVIGDERQRHFFRAYADEVRVEVQRWLDRYDADDPVSVEVCAWVRQKAVDRCLQRHPSLIADTADAGTKLSYVELAALAASAKAVLSSSVNAIDSMTARQGVLSLDQFDSTNHARVQGAGSGISNRA